MFFTVCSPGWGFAIGTEFQIHSWRLFILVCLFPALAALVGVVFMPESPRFLLEVRADVALLTYGVLFSEKLTKQIFQPQINNKNTPS